MNRKESSLQRQKVVPQKKCFRDEIVEEEQPQNC
jgi:hypothetical protein